MIIFTLRRLLLLLVTLFFLTFVGFSLSYFTAAPLQGSSLWDAWRFWFNGVLHWDFGVSSINGQLISEQLKEVFPATMELCILAFGFALLVGIPVGMLAGFIAINGRINLSAPSPCSASRSRSSGWRCC
jgi:cationic peptide transport system permease protein